MLFTECSTLTTVKLYFSEFCREMLSKHERRSFLFLNFLFIFDKKVRGGRKKVRGGPPHRLHTRENTDNAGGLVSG